MAASKRPTDPDREPAKKAAAKKAAVKKAAPAKKAAAKKDAPAKKAAAKKTAAKKAAPAKKAAAKKSATAKAASELSDLEQLLQALDAPTGRGGATKRSSRKPVKSAASKRRPGLPDRTTLVIAIVTVLVSLSAVGVAVFRRSTGSADSRCANAVADVRSIIAAQPIKEDLTNEQLDSAIAAQNKIRTYCAYNEADQVISQEVLPWLGVTIPTSIPTETTLPGATTSPGAAPSTTSGTPIGG